MKTKVEDLSVLVVDDHPLFRRAIKRLLNNISIVQFCDEAENGLKALEAMQNRHFDIVLLDIMMPVMDGIETAKVIRSKHSESKIIVLTMSDSKMQMIEMLELGVAGYVLKNTDETELTDAIIKVGQGSTYLSKEVDDVWTLFLGNKMKLELRQDKHLKLDLSDRELEIIRMICLQCSTQEMADKLSLSYNTVNSHRYNIMKKLDTDNAVGIAIFAVKNGLFIP